MLTGIDWKLLYTATNSLANPQMKIIGVSYTVKTDEIRNLV